ncbi:MAG: Glycosyl transferase group 1 [Berkelbacteria bacterium GW2011_GWA1_36_9]|uniref:Glycosyl transferase group 1 n=1 Tax=Berkelbacteria bacterium GW2011_GWA1_36_9 TaxID=1618331 RepID=A0A0G0I299_9BACT|nr:MAG: Glycosyl transferase group 1 [Berkelbacteria bacterium GW2011_GWA1_36_9]
MKIAVDISPLKTGHQVRGIGSYTKSLINEFKEKNWGIDFEFFKSPNSPPPVDIIHYPYFDLFFHTLPINKKASRVVVTIHDIIPLIFPEHFPVGLKGNINLRLQKLALKNVDAVICDSQTSKQDVINKLSLPEDKIHVVYLAPSEKFRPTTDKKVLSVVAKKYKLSGKFALYVGDVNWNKNLQNLIESIKIAKVNLVMVGKALADKSLLQTQVLNKLIKKLNLSEKIVKTGYVPDEDLVAIYNLADLTLLPSYYEGFGLPVLESMACGTSVVCSENSSLSEIAGPHAVFCNTDNPVDIARKIKKVMEINPKQKQVLSQKLIEHASNFTWAKTTRETANIYKLL